MRCRSYILRTCQQAADGAFSYQLATKEGRYKGELSDLVDRVNPMLLTAPPDKNTSLQKMVKRQEDQRRKEIAREKKHKQLVGRRIKELNKYTPKLMEAYSKDAGDFDDLDRMKNAVAITKDALAENDIPAEDALWLIPWLYLGDFTDVGDLARATRRVLYKMGELPEYDINNVMDIVKSARDHAGDFDDSESLSKSVVKLLG